MRSIEQTKRNEVIRLFFYGCTYDEIVARLSIAKGSVVNIIAEFRDGQLPEPSDLVDYIDELRRVAVDLKRHNTSVASMVSYLGLHTRLLEMGISDGDVERSLSICRHIAYSSISNEQFVQAALELGSLTAENNISYNELVNDYRAKLRMLNEVNDEIKRKERELKEKQESLKALQSAMIKRLPDITYHTSPQRRPDDRHLEYCRSKPGSGNRIVKPSKMRIALSICPRTN